MKFGAFMLLAGVAAAAGAQEPTVIENIYSQTGVKKLANDNEVAFEFASWYGVAQGETASLWPALFSEMGQLDVLVENVMADVDGIQLTYLSADKLLSVNCDAAILGHAQMLITDYNGVTRGLYDINEAPAQISLSSYVPGTYIVAVAVDGKLVKTLKLILK